MPNRLRAALVAVGCLLALTAIAGADPTRIDLGAHPVQSAEPHYLGNFDDQSLSLFRQSEAAEANRDYDSALRLMQAAAERQLERRGFELWDNLASLYCKRARASKSPRIARVSRMAGRAMLNEFRCAAEVWSGKRRCWLRGLEDTGQSIDDQTGLVPNPAVSPLCFSTLCGAGFGSKHRDRTDDAWKALMEAEPPDGYAEWPIEDGKDLLQIQKMCGVQ
jgi:hypothetical protein